jgi:hypothetical protein
MIVRNVHMRRLASAPEAVGRLVDSLASVDDRLWPRDRWPAMRFDRPLGIGAAGGHGPVRYTVVAYEPGRRVDFRFRAPRGFVGTHRYEIAAAHGGCELRHVLEIDAVGPARLTWPLVFRPLHDALIEDSLARAGESLGEPTAPTRWPVVVRLLRAALGPFVRASAPRASRGRSTEQRARSPARACDDADPAR